MKIYGSYKRTIIVNLFFSEKVISEWTSCLQFVCSGDTHRQVVGVIIFSITVLYVEYTINHGSHRDVTRIGRAEGQKYTM